MPGSNGRSNCGPGHRASHVAWATVFMRPSAFLAQRVAVLPASAILAVALEARRVLALGAGYARAAVRVALAVLQRESLQIDVRRRMRIALRLRRRGRAVGRRSQAASGADGRAAAGERYQ